MSRIPPYKGQLRPTTNPRLQLQLQRLALDLPNSLEITQHIEYNEISFNTNSFRMQGFNFLTLKYSQQSGDLRPGHKAEPSDGPRADWR